jgi:hypothetical protein
MEYTARVTSLEVVFRKNKLKYIFLALRRDLRG